MRFMINFFKHPRLSLFHFINNHVPQLIPDKAFVKFQYAENMGAKLNLEHPTLFTEKLNWMKLYGRNPLYTRMVDKFEAKGYVAEKIGSEHVIPAYGVWHSFDEIDFDQLPDQFVLKCNHDSGSYVICEDKSTFDKDRARSILEPALRKNYYWMFREWAYKNVDRRILAEQYIPSLGKKDSVEYKLTCFNGEVKVITVCSGIPHQAFELRHNDNYSRDWKRQNWYAYYKPTGKDFQKPAEMDEIIALSEKLSEGIPQVRVDWYIVDGNIYFGEFTFYTWAGYITFEPEEWNRVMGDWMTLPAQKQQ